LSRPIHLVWFRHDLRLTDNPALSDAAKHCANNKGIILPIFIYDNNPDPSLELGGASKWWLHHSLNALNESLDGNLQVFEGDAKEVVLTLIKEFDCEHVYWNRVYEPHQIDRDTSLKSTLKEKEVSCKTFNGSLLWEPWTIKNKSGEPYKVYTPYYRKGCLPADDPRYPIQKPKDLSLSNRKSESNIRIEDLKLLPEINWDTSFYNEWTAGEESAKKALNTFIKDDIKRYKEQRDIPNVRGTSRLSPHLRWGEISPNQIWYAVKDAFSYTSEKNIDTYLSEIAWREFSYYLLFHFPNLQKDNFAEKFNNFPWKNNAEHLKAWQQGRTGIPIVDAGMRELWQTGYMHNRVRMVVGSFLVKNLLLDWREGERWFWDCLCDADMASNSASWQWVAGCGADAAPFFRIFNPVLQGEKFDKQGEYVKTYCPELSELPNKYIHKPWEAPDDVCSSISFKLGDDYPAPIVDLKVSRKRALEAFETTKEDSK
jgi:deoxyribodipyrimidine photo-lyase